MIRRALALAGAAVLTVGVTGLAGPAAADSGAGVTQQTDVVLHELAAELDDAGSFNSFDGGFVELINESANVVELEEYTLEACDATSGPTSMVNFGPDDEIAANGGKYLIGDPAFVDAFGTVDPNINGVITLVQSGGGLRLEETSTGLADTLSWGSEPEGCEGFQDAGAIPNDLQSINRAGPPWVNATPTPEPAS